MLSRCDACSCLYRPVPGDGPEPAEILIIGDRPSELETKSGVPLSGPAGKETDETYFRLAGLRRENIRFTNTVKCHGGSKKTTEKEISACVDAHLQYEIRECDPNVIILLGATACSLIPDIDLDIEHGIPRVGELYGWDGPVIPMYHTNAGFHDTGKMIPLLEDWERVGKVLRGQWFAPDDPHPKPDYRLLTTPDEVYRSFEDLSYRWDREPIAIDTERHGEDAFSVQYSVRPGTGYMVLFDDITKRTISRLTDEDTAFGYFTTLLNAMHPEAIMHNAPQDMDWLERMGIKIAKFRDTMQEAYHLGNVPQGLKALAYRLLGIRMRTFEDVVTPASRLAVCNWLIEAVVYASSHLTYIEHKQLKTKVKEIRKPSQIERGLNRIYSHTLKGDKYDPWDKLAELFENDRLSDDERIFVESIRPEVKERVAKFVIARLTGHPGEIPILGIKNVPMEEAVAYGCADADITLRVAHKLARLREEFIETLNVSEEDYDK